MTTKDEICSYDPLDLTESSTTSNAKEISSKTALKLRIKASNHLEDLTIITRADSTVLQLKDTVRSALGSNARGRYLRLVSSGRLLAPDSASLLNFRLKEDGVIHAVLAAAGVRGGQQAALAGPTTRRIRGIGISPNGIITRNSDDDAGGDSSEEEDPELGVAHQGFDRLRSSGLSRSEIRALRGYFSEQVDSYMQRRRRLQNSENVEQGNDDGSNAGNDSDDNVNPSTSEEQLTRQGRTQMEDEWMRTQGPNSEFRLNLNRNNPLLASRMIRRNRLRASDDPLVSMTTGNHNTSLGTDRDFIWGFILGYLIGFTMICFMWLPTVPYKQKLGILTGICFQITLNLLNSGALEDLDPN